MLEDARQVRSHALYAADRYAQLAIVDGAAPRRCARYIHERLLRIKRYRDGVARQIAEVPRHFVILAVERGEQVAAESIGGFLALEVEIEVAVFALRKIRSE